VKRRKRRRKKKGELVCWFYIGGAAVRFLGLAWVCSVLCVCVSVCSAESFSR
jgi:hypothetical protein